MVPAQFNERRVVLLIGMIQFINVLDFMMVMPLGPDFAKALGVPASEIGIVGGAYTLAAAVSGIACSFFLDRFDRRKALAVIMGGLVVGTAAGGLAWDFHSLVAARLLAGAFGGPATSISYAIIADVIPVERRGKAMGAVLSAFAFASVFGVPAGLEMARFGGWQTPFFAVALLGLVTAVAVIAILPPLRIHLERKESGPKFRVGDLLRRSVVIVSFVMTATVMMASFMIIPNIAAYIQRNLDYPRESMGILYAAGGAVSFFAMRMSGRLTDRYGSFVTGAIGSALLVFVLYFGFVSWQPWCSVMGLFILFMLAMSFRNVAYNTLTSRVPAAHERAGFLSIQSAIQHVASSAGAFLSAAFLHEYADGSLGGIDLLAVASIALTVMLPVLMRSVLRSVRAATPVVKE